MNKLLDIFEPEIPKLKEDLLRIDVLLNGDRFLKGLGSQASELKKQIDFPLIDNYLKAAEMLVSESIYELPEPLPYQCFMEIVEEENGRIKYNSSLSNERRIEIRENIEEKINIHGSDLSDEILTVINSQYKKHKIKKYLFGRDTPTDNVEDWIVESPDHVICNIFPNQIEGLLSGVINASFYVGLENSSFYTRILEAFETGGMPAGWVGPMPENGGGLPEDCLQLLYFGALE